jgi:hypothetical protein
MSAISTHLVSTVRKTSFRRPPNSIRLPPSQTGSGEENCQYLRPQASRNPKEASWHPPIPCVVHRFRASVAIQSLLNVSVKLYGDGRDCMTSGIQDIPYNDDVGIYSTVTSSFPIPDRLSNILPTEVERASDLSGGVQDHILSTPS